MRLKFVKIRILPYIPLLVLLTGCAGTQLLPTVFKVNQSAQDTRLSLSPEGTVTTVQVVSDLEWSARMQTGEWISVASTTAKENSEGLLSGTVTLQSKANTAGKGRADTLLVTSGKAVLKLALEQKPLSSLLSHEEIELNGVNPVRISVSARGSWTATPGADWFRVSSTSGSGTQILDVQAVDDNRNVGSRTSQLLFTFGGASLSVPVSQGQTDVILFDSSGEVVLPCEGGNFNILTQSNVDFQIQVDDDWIAPVGTKALNEREVSFKAAPNEEVASRTTLIRFMADSFSETISVLQKGIDPIMVKTDYGFYGLDGGDALYDAGTDQISRLYSGDKVAFRLLHPGSRAVHVLSGIPVSPALGDSFPVTSVRVDADYGQSSRKEHNVTVLKLDGEKVWLKESDKVYFIVKI